MVAGILLAYLSNYLIGLLGFGETEWRWKLGISALAAVLFLAMLFAIPRSPRWLVSQGRPDEAKQVLRQIGEENIEAELQRMVASVHLDEKHGAEPLFRIQYRLPIFLAISIGMFNQLSGINAILYYLNDIFAKAGFTKVSGDLQAAPSAQPTCCLRSSPCPSSIALGARLYSLSARSAPPPVSRESPPCSLRKRMKSTCILLVPD